MARLRLGLLLAATAFVSACEDGSSAFGGDAAGTTASAGQTTQLVETDVEAPEVFQVTGPGLWDGRPSLGGVWVAHPDVTDPERVIIRNQENGTFVIGALFRRERDNPGPALQVSSDAAEALQMLAGAPATLNVTALRREEAAEPAPTEATTGAAPEATAAAAAAPAATAALASAPAVAATSLDPIAGAAAAIANAEAAGVPGAITSAPLGAAPAGVETTPLPAAEPVAAVAAAAPATTTSSLNRPYIQLGIFSVEANADALAQEMTANGMPSRVVAQESQGSSFWRVLVGPASDEAARAAMLDRVKAEGFADAYFVAN